MTLSTKLDLFMKTEKQVGGFLVIRFFSRSENCAIANRGMSVMISITINSF